MGDGKVMVESLRKTSYVYQNVASMVFSADDILRERAYFVYDWACVYPSAKDPGLINYSRQKDTFLMDTLRWLPEFVIRQFGPKDRWDTQVLTVGAVLYLKDYEDFDEPLCIASLIEGNFEEDDIYWISLLQAFDPTARKKRGCIVIGEDSLRKVKDYEKKKESFDKRVKGGRFVSNAVPLLEITNSLTLKEKVILPVLNHK
jgi:hypothetical protein